MTWSKTVSRDDIEDFRVKYGHKEQKDEYFEKTINCLIKKDTGTEMNEFYVEFIQPTTTEHGVALLSLGFRDLKYNMAWKLATFEMEPESSPLVWRQVMDSLINDRTLFEERLSDESRTVAKLKELVNATYSNVEKLTKDHNTERENLLIASMDILNRKTDRIQTLEGQLDDKIKLITELQRRLEEGAAARTTHTMSPKGESASAIASKAISPAQQSMAMPTQPVSFELSQSQSHHKRAHGSKLKKRKEETGARPSEPLRKAVRYRENMFADSQEDL
eukprot:CFRG5850T1